MKEIEMEIQHKPSVMARLQEIANSDLESDPVAEAESVRADLRSIAHVLFCILDEEWSEQKPKARAKRKAA